MSAVLLLPALVYAAVEQPPPPSHGGLALVPDGAAHLDDETFAGAADAVIGDLGGQLAIQLERNLMEYPL